MVYIYLQKYMKELINHLYDGTIVYTSLNPQTFWVFERVILALCEYDWFINYAERWIWRNDNGYGEKYLTCDDALLYFANRESQ